MIEELKRWIPEGQKEMFTGVIIIWMSSLFYFLFTGGKIGFLLFFIMTFLNAYLLFLTRWSGIQNIEGERTRIGENSGSHLESGDSFLLETTFKIPGFWPITYVMVRDEIVHHQGGATIHESTFVPDFYRSGKVKLTIESLKRGSYQLGDVVCSTGDLLDLFEHKKRLHLPYQFKVYPKTVPIKEWKFQQAKFRSSSSARFERETTLVDGVREYIPGERLSKIHWKASAKTGELKTKEFIRESVPKVIIVLDQSSRAYKNEHHFELAVSTAASLLAYLRKQQVAVGLFSLGKKPIFFEPVRAKKGEGRMEEQLLFAAPDGRKNIVEALTQEHFRRLSGSQVVVISPDSGEELPDRLLAMKKMKIRSCLIEIAESKERQHNPDDLKNKFEKGQLDFYQISHLDELPEVLRRGR